MIAIYVHTSGFSRYLNLLQSHLQSSTIIWYRFSLLPKIIVSTFGWIAKDTRALISIYKHLTAYELCVRFENVYDSLYTHRTAYSQCYSDASNMWDNRLSEKLTYFVAVYSYVITLHVCERRDDSWNAEFKQEVWICAMHIIYTDAINSSKIV